MRKEKVPTGRSTVTEWRRNSCVKVERSKRYNTEKPKKVRSRNSYTNLTNISKIIIGK